jgi:hypothetical protein
MHDCDGEPWPKATARAIKWVDRELEFAGSLAANILYRRWEDVSEFAERLVGDLFVRETLQDLKNSRQSMRPPR